MLRYCTLMGMGAALAAFFGVSLGGMSRCLIILLTLVQSALVFLFIPVIYCLHAYYSSSSNIID